MVAQSYWGSNKPPAGIPLDLSHPLTDGIRLCMPFNELGGVPQEIMQGRGVTQIGAPTWGGTELGSAQRSAATTDYWNLGLQMDLNLPLTQVTVLVIRRKTDATLRATATFGPDDLDASAPGTWIAANAPYSDGVVYWIFGGAVDGITMLSIPGLSFDGLQKWVFVAGSRGMSVYLDGELVGSHANYDYRFNHATEPFLVNAGPGAEYADLQDYNFFGLLDAEWNASQVQEWSAAPFGMFLPPVWRRLWVPGVPATSGAAQFAGFSRLAIASTKAATSTAAVRAPVRQTTASVKGGLTALTLRSGGLLAALSTTARTAVAAIRAPARQAIQATKASSATANEQATGRLSVLASTARSAAAVLTALASQAASSVPTYAQGAALSARAWMVASGVKGGLSAVVQSASSRLAAAGIKAATGQGQITSRGSANIVAQHAATAAAAFRAQPRLSVVGVAGRTGSVALYARGRGGSVISIAFQRGSLTVADRSVGSLDVADRPVGGLEVSDQ